MRPLFFPRLAAMKTEFAYKHVSLYAWLLISGLALSWLIPNHYPPWLAFHSNAWVGISLLLIALRVVYISKTSVELERGGIALLLIALIPLLQYMGGLLPLMSDTVLRTLYLFGAATAYILACHWNKIEPFGAASHILAATAIAAVGSAGLATYQWLGLAQNMGLMDIWVLPFAEGTRPYANIGQPNQLASLLLCGLLGVAWSWNKRQIGGLTAAGLAAWILWGVALTESRTVMLTVALGFGVVTVAGTRYLQKPEVRAVQALLIFYFVCLFGKGYLAQALGLDIPLSMLERSAGELRISLWKMSLEASLQSPWWGFGWGRSNAGYFLVYEKYQQTFGNTYFEQSHNLILDLALWAGWPFAAIVTTAAGLWFVRTIKTARSVESFIILMALSVFLIHAMLEFPLHYGYFLWPFFALAGSLSSSHENRETPVIRIPKPWSLTIIAGLLVSGFIIITDYLKIEESFSELRFQIARIGSGHDETLPKTWILTDWPDVIALARETPRSGMTGEEIRHWEALLMYNTSPLALRKVIGANRLNGKEAEAQAWARRACWLLSQSACRGLIEEWEAPKDSTIPGALPSRP